MVTNCLRKQCQSRQVKLKWWRHSRCQPHEIFSCFTKPVLLSGETAAYSGHKSHTEAGMASLKDMRHVYLLKKHLYPWFIASFICKLLWIKAQSWMPHNPIVCSAISVELLSSVRKWHCRWSQLIRKQKSTFCSCVFLFMTHICTYVQAHTHRPSGLFNGKCREVITEVTDEVNHLWMMALKIIKQ